MDVTAVSTTMLPPPESGIKLICRLPSHATTGLSTMLITAQLIPCVRM
jgi:hypothetical protein